MNRTAEIILRWGLAFTFFYAAIAGLLNPNDWIGYLPGFLTATFPAGLVLAVFSVYEIILAVLLFAGRKLRWASLLSALTFAGIVISNIGILEITFRDVGLMMAALALYELVKNNKNTKAEEEL
ncbi:MAG: hypothetical protein KGJ89_01835 [Patescibacteria group bacterium]|nr:hypothetical protein [Patescibacteria group bacterium]MDE2015618.1 hypothetical protein [Patescibacteria group bacterium]MDE2226675.1 hypothetical protein [Patescibacteria group bacterium]